MSCSDVPEPVRAYIKACNAFDLGGLVATFSGQALVNDQRREYVGLPAIRYWAAREIVADRVTMEVTETAIRGDHVVVTAQMDGEYDKTGLPDPLVLTFYFSLAPDRIAQLIILRNQAVGDLVLAHPLDRYFAAKNKHDARAMSACFAEDAVVMDEAHQHNGRPAIHEWIEDTTRKYRVTADPIDARQADGKTVVTCLLSGDFPGSPAKLRYAFTLSDAKIARLEIV